MAELKTRASNRSVAAFLKSVDNEARRADCLEVVDMMKKITRKKPRIWGESIVGFGTYHYRYDSGREGDSFITGFSPRKQYLTIYIMPGFSHYSELMKKLGKYKTGACCLYLKTLDDIDRAVLKELVSKSVQHMRETHECR